MPIMTLFFWVIIIAQILATISIVFSILFPSHRIWPPDKPSSWRHYLMWFLFDISTIGIVVVGILDWKSLSFPPWMQIALGLPLSVGGIGFSLWSIFILGRASTYGDEGPLILSGPYSISRNPQYLGFIAALIGWSIITSSCATIVAVLVWVIPLVLIPFAEEPWLLRRHGSEYEEYLRKVHRFMFLKKRSKAV
jgi:protein-S-isoprenylcysteine O-methyltransferase Ste14